MDIFGRKCLDDCMDAGGRITPGAVIEQIFQHILEQRPRTKSGTEVESDVRLHGRRTTPGTEDDSKEGGGTPPWTEKVENVGTTAWMQEVE